MPAKVTLTVTRGKLQGQEFTFDDRTTAIVGRSTDCRPCLPDDTEHKTISRHHCLLDINPPDVRVRDFGSLNGTYVNGTKIGQRDKDQTPEDAAKKVFPEHDLEVGDEIELGNTVFKVGMIFPLICGDCQEEIPEEQKAACEQGQSVYQCLSCQKKAKAARQQPAAQQQQQQQPAPQHKPRVCPQCHQDVSHEPGGNRPGDFLCARCKANPAQIAQGLLAVQGYDCIKELGRGGMGAVFLARHKKTQELVALKVMLPQVAVAQRARAMFLREGEMTLCLKHPNLVPLRDIGCSNGIFYLVLDYCDGGSVDRLMQMRGGILAVDEAVGIVLQALAGLEYAHHAPIVARMADGNLVPTTGVVHRDLKPQNILLSGTGNSRVAKIGDFGLSKAFDLAGLSGHTAAGVVAGSLNFLPRQQVINFKYAKPEVDVWAMAASLYFMLTGWGPRDFPANLDPWQVVLQTNAVPIRRRLSSIPRKLADLIDTALIDQPAIHFKSAAEFRRALQGAL